jgi:Phage stabilisation protein
MPQIPVIQGIYTDNTPDLRSSYPVNLVPVPRESGISSGFLRPADGLVSNGTGPGTDRGGIEWNGTLYRVMGTKLVSISSAGAVTILGDVGGSGYVTFDYSFDRLAVVSSNNLFYWDGTTLTQVTDPDLGPVLDMCWVDGYFMTTDGTSLVVTELTDPTAVNPLKYGSSEIDPDPVVALLKLRNEVYALNRHTIEVFDNIGGEFFPFQRIDGAQIQKGAIGTFGCCVYLETVAFLGSGKNEAPGIYLGANSTATKISTQEIDEILLGYTEKTRVAQRSLAPASIYPSSRPHDGLRRSREPGCWYSGLVLSDNRYRWLQPVPRAQLGLGLR